LNIIYAYALINRMLKAIKISVHLVSPVKQKRSNSVNGYIKNIAVPFDVIRHICPLLLHPNLSSPLGDILDTYLVISMAKTSLQKNHTSIYTLSTNQI